MSNLYELKILLLLDPSLESGFVNPLTANDELSRHANEELSRHENLTFLWTWILSWVPRSFATHVFLCNTLSSNVQKQ